MAGSTRTTRFRFWLWLIRVIGVIVPRRLRRDWRQEWEAELRYRELQLADWDRLDLRHKVDLLWRSTSAFWDALWLQPQRLEDEMFQDLRYGARMLVKHPGFTFIAVLTLSLGIGANTAIFSIVNAVLLRPFPYQTPERLVFVQERVSPGTGFSPSYPNFADWRTQNTAFDSIAAVRANESFNFTGAGEPKRLQGRLVSAEFFSTLGIKPLHGRDFLTEEDRQGATPAVILSHGFWQRRFGADESIIGKQLTLNNQSFTVVGITPASFQFGVDADVSVPIGLSAERFRVRGADPGTDVVARLKSTQTLLLGVSALTALILAALGLYGLLSYLVEQRTQEIGIRVALGAQRSDVLKLLIGQGMALVLTGVVTGLTASLALTRWLKSLLFGVSATDPLTFLAVALLLIAVALLACYLPARRACRLDPLVALRHE